MRRLDDIAVTHTGPTLLQMMENAGRNLATLVPRLIPISKEQTIVVLAGTGANGGGAICAARHLANHGYPVALAVSDSEALRETQALQLRIYRNTTGSEVTLETLPDVKASVILDGLIGYGLRNAPEGAIAEMIYYANQSHLPIISIDVPSGIDATDGSAPGVAISPEWTMTFALPKTGLRSSNSGDIYLADIGIPRAAFDIAGIEYTSPFVDDYLVFMERDQE